MLNYIRDSRIKKLFESRQKLKALQGIIPDAAWFRDNSIWCLEYENSSRGMTTHVAGYALAARNLECKVNVLMVRSLQHQLKHSADYNKAVLVAELVTKDNPNLLFTFNDCDNTEQGLQDTVHEWLLRSSYLHGDNAGRRF